MPMSLSVMPLPESREHFAPGVGRGPFPCNPRGPARAFRMPSAAPPVNAKIANGREQLAAAFQLVYDRYLAEGYVEARPGRLLYYEVLGSPSSRTIVALERRGKVLGTLSIVGDNPLGLQAEATYPSEIASLRASGRRPAEITCLAIRKQDRLATLSVFFELTRLMIHYAYWRRYSDLLLAIHPKHFRFYDRYFRPYPVGPPRPHALACGHPAICHRIDLEHLRHNVSAELWEQYFAEPVPEDEFQRPPIRPADHEYFCYRSRLSPHSGCIGRRGKAA